MRKRLMVAALTVALFGVAACTYALLPEAGAVLPPITQTARAEMAVEPWVKTERTLNKQGSPPTKVKHYRTFCTRGDQSSCLMFGALNQTQGGRAHPLPHRHLCPLAEAAAPEAKGGRDHGSGNLRKAEHLPTVVKNPTGSSRRRGEEAECRRTRHDAEEFQRRSTRRNALCRTSLSETGKGRTPRGKASRGEFVYYATSRL